MAEQKILISIQVKTGKSNQQIKATTKSLDQLATTQKKVSTGNNDMRATAGLNNAILMETSRLASDASFGFTAIANNLSQLVNLFKASKDATGSYSQSIKSLLNVQSALLIGFQLLITFGDDLYRMIINAVGGGNLLKETFKDAGSTVEDSAGKFETYIRTLQDSTKSQDEQNDAIQSLKKEFPDYLNQLDEAGVSLDDVAKNTAEAARQNDIYRDSITKLSMARAAQNMIDELTAERVQLLVERRRKLFEQGLDDDDYVKARIELDKLRIEQADELAAAREKEAEVNAMLANATEKTMGTAMRMSEEFGETEAGQLIEKENRLSRIVDINQKEIDSIDEKIQELIKFTDIEISESKRGAGGRNRAYREGDLDFEKERQQSREREIESIIKNEEALLIIESEGIKERARIKQKEFVEDEERRLDAFKRRTDDAEAIAEATKLSNAAIANSEDELNQYIVRINEETDTKLLQMQNDFAKERYDNKVKNDAEFAELELLEETADIGNEGRRATKLFNLDTEQLEQKKARLEAEMAFRSTFMFGLMNDQQTQIQLQEELTQVEQDLSKKRIKIAETEAFAKREGLRVTGDALDAFSELAGKETSKGKTLAIASTLISTYQTAQAAFESQFKPISTADSPIRGAIAAAAAIARGLAQVKQIRSVKVPKEKGGGGAQGAVQIQAPDFNVVGASQTSQLAQTITEQKAKPVKAFVVGKDISTQQELDRNITNTASFG